MCQPSQSLRERYTGHPTQRFTELTRCDRQTFHVAAQEKIERGRTQLLSVMCYCAYVCRQRAKINHELAVGALRLFSNFDTWGPYFEGVGLAHRMSVPSTVVYGVGPNGERSKLTLKPPFDKQDATVALQRWRRVARTVGTHCSVAGAHRTDDVPIQYREPDVFPCTRVQFHITQIVGAQSPFR